MSVLFFKPIPRPAIWGKTLVKDYFGYDDFEVGIGQSWSFSAQENDSNICVSEPYRGSSLKELWDNHKELFQVDDQNFPVIISLVGPEDDLSIQVHPDTTKAKERGFLSGKNEAWYFIHSEENSSIVYGHNADDEADLREYVKEEKWDELINHLEVKSGDFVYLPAGLLHALKRGSVVYEIQQATDITYRFYDYHRVDDLGHERELHLEDAIDCLSYNKEDMVNTITPLINKYDQCIETIFMNDDSFKVSRLEIDGEFIKSYPIYQLATVVVGEGRIDQVDIKVGDNFLIPANTEFKVNGHLTIMMTTKEG